MFEAKVDCFNEDSKFNKHTTTGCYVVVFKYERINHFSTIIMNTYVASVGLVVTLVPLFRHCQCDTLTVADLNMCCAAATILKRSFFIFHEKETCNQCIVGPVVTNDKLCDDGKVKVGNFI